MLELRLLGEPLAVDGSGEIKQPWPTQVALLAYLALAGVVARSTLAGVFWADVPDKSARRALRQALFQLRRSLGEVVCTTGDCMRLDWAQISVDVCHFEQLLDVGRHAEAVGLYTDDFLVSFALGNPSFDEWADRQRSRLAGRAAGAFLPAGPRAPAASAGSEHAQLGGRAASARGGRAARRATRHAARAV